MVSQNLRHYYLGLLLVTTATISGCKDPQPPTVHPTPPTSIASAIDFEDKLLGPGIGGKIFVTRTANDNDATSYVVRWSSNGAAAATNASFPSNFITRFEITSGVASTPYEFDLYFPSLPPAELGINGIIVYTANPVGENPNGLEIRYENVIDNNQGQPAFPQSVTFADTDERLQIAGNVSFVPPTDESNISDYVIRYASENGCALEGNLLATIARGESPTHTLAARIPPTAARSIVVIPRDLAQNEPERCAAFPHSEAAAFNVITASTTPTYLANRVTIEADSDDSDNFTATLSIQGSRDERDLSTGYYVNLRNDVTGTCGESLAYFPKSGNRQWHTFEFTHWQIPRNTTKLMISTGTECGFAGGEPHEIDLVNLRGDWHLIKSTTGEQCLRVGAEEPAFPDNDGLSSVLHFADCNTYDMAQRFNVTNLWLDDGPNIGVIFQISAIDSQSCVWRRDNTSTQEWQVKRVCDGSEGLTTQVQLLSAGNSGRNKRMAIRRQVGGAYEYSCATTTAGGQLSSSWATCSAPQLFNFAPAGTSEPSRYSVFYAP